MKIMDRYLFRNFLMGYCICLFSLVGLHVIIDLFANADEFLEDHPNTFVFLRRAGLYYGIHLFDYFARLSPIITQIAAMTTLASLHQQNEIVALLAAGVPTRRALFPILLGVGMMIGLGLLNREIILPMNAERLQRIHEDIEANNSLNPAEQFDREGVLIRARRAYRHDFHVEEVNITLSRQNVGQVMEIEAPLAYSRIDEATGKEGWLIVKPSRADFEPNAKIKKLANGDLFLYSNVTFYNLIRRRHWMNYASTWELIQELQSNSAKNPQVLRGQIHGRFIEPFEQMLLVLIGIPFVLHWERKNIYRSIAVSMLWSALFFVADATSGYFANYGYLDPLTAAWLPTFVFAPLAFSWFHRIGT